MPLAQHFGKSLGALSTAALLCAGAVLVGLLSRQPVEREARLLRGDLPRLFVMAAFGAVLGLVALGAHNHPHFHAPGKACAGPYAGMRITKMRTDQDSARAQSHVLITKM